MPPNEVGGWAVFRGTSTVAFVDGVPPYITASVDGQDLFGVPGYTSLTTWANDIVNALYGPQRTAAPPHRPHHPKSARPVAPS
ncbi:MAG: hypothetical protein IPG96_19350 [Proteobacteria bacterium]|nr:hypothetical protein [Pseudomonadota bacterium]